MKRSTEVLTVLTLSITIAGCHPVTQQEHDALSQSHQTVVGQLGTWSGQVYDWQNRTYQTICEIATEVDPNGDGDYSDIGAATQAYCGPGNGGTPDAPPNWGA